MDNTRKTIASKLIKTRIILRNKHLQKHVPATHPFNQTHLSAMLVRYGMIYVKPDAGSLGIGVMRVEKKGSSYRYQSGVRTFTFPTFQKLFQSLQRACGSKRYLIQKGVHVLKHEGKPFDFRVMIQKKPSGGWECTGTAGRVAHPLKAVTNGSQGGTIYSPTNLIEPKYGSEATTSLLKKMEHIAQLTAAQFSRSYPAMNELGLDIAVDRKLNPWILEVNTHPDPCPFTKLEDKAIIRKIVTYAKAYGRRYDLTCSKAKKAPK